ncbi:haloacid dehalogenase-like hydrolase [Parachlamydia sp. AcF125]|uniref:HAD family hydrolase n=1 Tax=Parachlamydia sp. AcF125 TaxID=2795736 RepID=UPI001BC8E117|nr:haloacid dehalogenase-like hydrolase [Parachlamydia sp. AcF125]MBS4168500.1 putative phosphatase [Parachlamydia sp. AcF125]
MLKTPTHLTVFDLDHTLLLQNSSLKLGIYLYQTGKLTWYKMCLLIACYGLHKIGVVSFRRLHLLCLKIYFQFIAFSELETWIEEFLDSQFEKMINPLVVSKLGEAQQLNHYTILLSTSPAFLVKHFAKRFQVDYWKGTSYIVENDKLIGVASVLGGQDKATYVASFLKEKGIPLHHSTAYTDHIADLPLLQTVGNAVVVNPSKKLRRLCLQNNWTVLN